MAAAVMQNALQNSTTIVPSGGILVQEGNSVNQSFTDLKMSQEYKLPSFPNFNIVEEHFDIKQNDTPSVHDLLHAFNYGDYKKVAEGFNMTAEEVEATVEQKIREITDATTKYRGLSRLSLPLVLVDEAVHNAYETLTDN